MAEPTAFTANILGVADLIESDTNKVSAGNNLSPEGVFSDPIDVLDLPMDDEELLKLRDQWEAEYAPYEGKVAKPIGQRNLRSYLGRDPRGAILDTGLPGAANLQFEAEETFLPAALAENPDPVVFSDNSPEGNAVSGDVKTMLQFHAQQLLLKRKLEVMIRQWSIYQLAVLKPGWDEKIKDVAIDNRKIQDFLFDPGGFVDVHGHFSSWLGERITVTAQLLTELFPKHKQYIVESVGGEDKLGTKVVYTEWWEDDYCFSTYKQKVLDKHKNEYFNYEEKPQVDELTGMPGPVQKKRNQFAIPQKPYVFLSVFSLQERPHDITGLIEQNIPNQAKVSKRVEQIDDNISQSNNGLIFSEQNFNQETAKQAANALTDGVGKVLVPQGGPIAEAVVRLPAPSFPDAGFKDLENSENHLRSSWGIQGIASQPQKPDETARGMILNQGRDTSRIGGGISGVVEQSVARSVFEWLVQLYCVFYDEPHFASVMGIGKAVQYAQISSKDIDRPLVIGVSPNSMKPKDEIAQMNTAQSLFEKGAIGPKVLLETLDFPNPDEAAADGMLYKLDPMSYFKMNFPEEAGRMEQLMMQQAQQQQEAQRQQAQQDQQGVAQEQAQGQQAHFQKLQQNEETHKQKLSHATEMASAKLANVKLPV